MHNHDTDNRTDMTEYTVSVDQLQPGVFIRLTGLSWMDHPFMMNSFKIIDTGQIKALRQLGLEKVVFVPAKSDVFPLPLPTATAPASLVKVKDMETEQLLIDKRKRIEQQKIQRQKIKACEKKFTASVKTVKNVMRNIEGGRPESVKDANDLLTNLIDELLLEKDTSLQLMSTEAAGGESVFYHSLNVSVLALMLGRASCMEEADLRILGLGALFHDVGKHLVPKNVLFKPTTLTKFELDILRLHPSYGVETMQPLVDTGAFPSEALFIIQDHHERIDGSGYPSGRKREDISHSTKIVSIVDRYDNLCNNPFPEKSVTPHEALAFMFSKERTKFDTQLLQRFIAYLGVYPPGTIVRLNNGIVGMVISVYSRSSLRPSLLIYNPEIPKNEALIFDLSEDKTLSIASSIRPSQLPSEIYDYLNPRTRLSYFLSTEDTKKASIPAGASGSEH